jgi:hypothetical protein
MVTNAAVSSPFEPGVSVVFSTPSTKLWCGVSLLRTTTPAAVSGIEMPRPATPIINAAVPRPLATGWGVRISAIVWRTTNGSPWTSTSTSLPRMSLVVDWNDSSCSPSFRSTTQGVRQTGRSCAESKTPPRGVIVWRWPITSETRACSPGVSRMTRWSPGGTGPRSPRMAGVSRGGGAGGGSVTGAQAVVSDEAAARSTMKFRRLIFMSGSQCKARTQARAACFLVTRTHDRKRRAVSCVELTLSFGGGSGARKVI